MFDNVTTTAEIDAVSMEIIASIVQSELIQSAALGVTVEDFSSLAKPGAASVKIPSAGSFSVMKKQGGQAVTAQKLTFGGDSILFDQQAVIQALVEDIANIQSAVPVVAEYLKRMASAHALQIDKDLFAQIKLVAAANKKGYSSGSAPTKADFTLAKKVLKDQGLPLDNQLFCAFSTDNERVMQNLSDFVDADKWLSASSEIKINGMFPGGQVGTGFIGRAYGFNLISTTVVPDSDNGLYFYHRSHAGIAFQQGPRIQEQYKLEHLANLVSMDQLYGVKVLDSGKRACRVGA
jgi:hypothetical protein